MEMIDTATAWVEIIKLPTYDIDELMGDNYEYIDK